MTEKEHAILWLSSLVKNKEPMILVPKPLIRLMHDVLTRKPITNYDRIISKSPEELAKFLAESATDKCAPGHYDCYPWDHCGECWLDWLREEATDGV